MKKYYKNGSLNFIFILISIMYLLIILPVHICLKPDLKFTSFIFIGLVSPFIIYFVVGFYWAFQKITIDKEGINFYLFNKKIKVLSWNNIESITFQSSKICCYFIKEKDINKYHNIYISRNIESLMKKFAPKELFCE